MAGNSNSGRNPTFSVSDKELERLFSDYRTKAESGEFRPSWPDWCSKLGYTEREVAQVMQLAESPNSAYYMRANRLKRIAAWMRGQYMSNPLWGGQMQSKAIFALKQDVGDGYKYTDQDRGSTGPVSVSVSFGGADKRASKAAK